MPARPVLLFGVAVVVGVMFALVLGLTIPASGFVQGGFSVVEPVAVLSLYVGPPVNPGGPAFTLDVENVGVFSIATLSATLVFLNVGNATFGVVAPEAPLPPGATVSQTIVLIGPWPVTCNAAYPIEFAGSYPWGGSFAFTAVHTLECPPPDVAHPP